MSEQISGPATRVAALSEIPDGGVLAVEAGGCPLALVRDGDQVYALRDECSHAAIALSEGEVSTDHHGVLAVECWLHGSRFDVASGTPLNLPAIEPVPTYPTRIEGDDVLVALPEEN